MSSNCPPASSRLQSPDTRETCNSKIFNASLLICGLQRCRHRGRRTPHQSSYGDVPSASQDLIVRIAVAPIDNNIRLSIMRTSLATMIEFRRQTKTSSLELNQTAADVISSKDDYGNQKLRSWRYLCTSGGAVRGRLNGTHLYKLAIRRASCHR